MHFNQILIVNKKHTRFRRFWLAQVPTRGNSLCFFWRNLSYLTTSACPCFPILSTKNCASDFATLPLHTKFHEHCSYCSKDIFLIPFFIPTLYSMNILLWNIRKVHKKQLKLARLRFLMKSKLLINYILDHKKNNLTLRGFRFFSLWHESTVNFLLRSI